MPCSGSRAPRRRFPGAKPGQRATQLADAASDTGSGLLATLGRPARESACECERSSDLRLGSVMALLSGPTISAAINDPTNALAQLVETEKDDRKLVNEVFLRVAQPARHAPRNRRRSSRCWPASMTDHSQAHQ